jgi:DNA-binding CsgD family transcriptional regulator
MRRIIIFSGLAIALFLTLAAIEAIQAESLEEFALDLFEKAILTIAVVATTYVSVELREMRVEHSALVGDLARARAEGDRWRAAARVHIDGLGRAIREQFDAWRLTASEADVALLMLKGLSHKEIARLRNSSEATVRQQAAAIYGKSGMASRAELSAFFLEDLFGPESERDAPELPPLKVGSKSAGRASHMS